MRRRRKWLGAADFIARANGIADFVTLSDRLEPLLAKHGKSSHQLSLILSFSGVLPQPPKTMYEKAAEANAMASNPPPAYGSR